MKVGPPMVSARRTAFIASTGYDMQTVLTKRQVGWPAAIIASAVFAVAHIIQGSVVALFIFVVSIGFHGLVRYCGDLYTAMVVHFLYDVAIGYIVGFVLKPLPATRPA